MLYCLLTDIIIMYAHSSPFNTNFFALCMFLHYYVIPSENDYLMDSLNVLISEGLFHQNPLNDFSYNIPGGFSVMGAQILHVWSEPLIQPEIIPPFQRHEVSKPLEDINHMANRVKPEVLPIPFPGPGRTMWASSWETTVTILCLLPLADVCGS